nr:unnamed protein product [Digitaria exilis]
MSTDKPWKANPDMGASNSRETPKTAGGENVRFKYASASIQGFGAEMEDAYAVLPDLDQTTSFFGLYDGHGGAEVALLCAKLFHVELQVHPNYHENLDIAIRRMFSRMDELLLQSEEWRTLVKPTGDGDFVFKQNNNLPPEEQMVICDPDILSMEITNDIEFLVIASRGIWASLSRQAVVDFVHDELQFGETDLRLICERLVAHAQPTVFDTTVILIQFKHAAADEAVENQEVINPAVGDDDNPAAGDDNEPAAGDNDKPAAGDDDEPAVVGEFEHPLAPNVKPAVSEEPFAPNG